MPTSLLLAFSAIKKPAIGVIILEVFWYGIEKISWLSFMAGDFLYLIKFALFCWVGWIVFKGGGELMDAIKAGVLMGVITELVDFILASILYSGYYSFAYWVKDAFTWILIPVILSAAVFYIAKNKMNTHGQDSSSNQNKSGDQTV